MDASLNEKLQTVKWGGYKLGDLFDIDKWTYGKNKNYETKSASPFPNAIPVISGITENNGVNYYTEDKLSDEEIYSASLTISTRGEYSGTVFYQPEKFVLAANILAMPMPDLSRNQKIFIGSLINALPYGGYNGYPRKETLRKDTIQLPEKNGKIDFEFMDSFIDELEASRVLVLKEYLSAAGLDDCTLTAEERKALEEFDSLKWDSYNLKDLFGKATRGKRLKSADRIDGSLPFVTAGEAFEGVSAYIGNEVEVFEANTTTIDMFGSAKYRNYKYGADDHVAIVHTESLPKYASVFVTAAIHKASHSGKFDYSRNFYAKDADALNILLPSKKRKPDYEAMNTFVSAIQKLAVQNVVRFVSQKTKSNQIQPNQNL
ncbi:MAG: restriction endonuclease subunit S [Clostridia bacterium]|nr:restriction endonuclease subunit S [Clostridia bacterium]